MNLVQQNVDKFNGKCPTAKIPTAKSSFTETLYMVHRIFEAGFSQNPGANHWLYMKKKNFLLIRRPLSLKQSVRNAVVQEIF